MSSRTPLRQRTGRPSQLRRRSRPALAAAGPVAPIRATQQLTQGAEQAYAFRRLPYLQLRTRLLIITLVALAWAGASTLLALPWIRDLGHSVTVPFAAVIVVGIAILPGYLNARLVASLLLDRPPELRSDISFPPITVLVACHNEADRIEQTLSYLAKQDYPAPLTTLVVDDGSTDASAQVVSRVAEHDPNVRLLSLPHSGKARALSTALQHVKTPLVATVDADTLLIPVALRRAVGRLFSSPPDTVAVAGSVMVRNSRANLLTHAQQWDYFLGIASVKRAQSLLQGTMVVQGAFSVYDTVALLSVGGWPDRIGEDIVLTWALLRAGWRTTYEATSIAFTDVPETLGALMRQRRRWARGMIEGLKEHGTALLRQRRPLIHSVIANCAFPYLDLTYTLAFPAGVVLAVLGIFAIVGPFTLAVLPLNLALAGLMYHLSRQAFGADGLRVRRAWRGLFAYLLLYQFVMAPISVAGYAQELLRLRRRW